MESMRQISAALSNGALEAAAAAAAEEQEADVLKAEELEPRRLCPPPLVQLRLQLRSKERCGW